jgi:Lrp/AsnC family leucine-responsive transcriptional regulator
VDDTDRKLLEALAANARSSYAELARLVGMSPPSVQDRVRRLEERGVITGYTATVTPEAVGLGVAALVGVYLSDTSDQDAVTRAIEKLPEVESCWFVAGEESFVLTVRTADVAALERTLARLRAVRGISRTRTTVVLSTKWEGRLAPPPA